MFDEVAHMLHTMFTWSHFTCYIIFVLLLLALPWESRNSQMMRLLIYGFSHKIYVGLFHDKKCYNCINLFSYILWDFIVLGLVLSWWRLLKPVKLATCSRVDNPWKVMWGEHVGSWRVKCQVVFCESLHDSGQAASNPWNSILGGF